MAVYPLFTGPTNTVRSRNVDHQRTVNWIPERSDVPGAKADLPLYRSPGCRPYVYLGVGPVRALFSQDGRTFAVGGGVFFEILQSQTVVTRGFMAVDGRPAQIASNGPGGNQLFIVSGGIGYIFDLSTDGFVMISDSAFPTNAIQCGFIDGYFIVLQAGTSRFYVSDLEDGTAWAGFDVAQMSQSSDITQAFIINHNEMWFLGSKTTTVWRDVGAANFPMEPMPGVFIEHGIVAPFSLCRIDNTIMWLGQDETGARMVWRANGYTPERLSTHAIEYRLSLHPRVDDAMAFVYQEQGHTFYVLYLPTPPKNQSYGHTHLVYDVSTGLWSERSIWDSQFQMNFIPHIARCQCFIAPNGPMLVGDRQSGTVYTMSLDHLYDELVLVSNII